MPPKTSNSPDANAQRAAYDEFSTAFADIEGDESSAAAAAATAPTSVEEPPAVPTAAGAADSAPVAAPPVAAEPVATAPVVAAEPVAEPVAPVAEPVAAAPVESDEKARIAVLEARIAELNKAVPAAPVAPAAAAEPAPAPVPVEPTWYQFNDDEKAVLDTYDKDWGEVSKAEAIRRKADIFNAVAYVFAQMRQHIEPKLKEFSEVSEQITSQLALSELRRQNDDYDSIYESVAAWVDTLPIPFRAGAKQVMEGGTTEEVNALIKEYRKSHPAAPASASLAAAPVAAGGKQSTANLSPAAKQAAQRLSVVGSKRSTQRGAAVDANDFDGAWEEALRESNA